MGLSREKQQIRCIRKLITAGTVSHARILSRLGEEGITGINPDHIAILSMKHRGGAAGSLGSALLKGAGTLTDRILSFAAALLSAGLFAEVAIARILSGTLIRDQLTGFGDHLLFWLNLKKLNNVSAMDLFAVFQALFASTFRIIQAMLIGAVCGILIWKILSRLVLRTLRRSALDRKIERLLDSRENRL